MSLDYNLDGSLYNFSYSELKESFAKYSNMSDSEFMENLPEIIHFACYVAWIKEIGMNAALSDKGIVHELVHLLAIPDEPLVDLEEIRNSFNTLLRLD